MDTSHREQQLVIEAVHELQHVNISGGSVGAVIGRLTIQLPPPPEDLTEAVERLAALPLDQLPPPGLLPPASRMELRRNPLFVGRATELRAIATMLKEPGAGAATVAVTGVGGLGKTNVATEFVHRYGRFFAGGVFWFNFARPDDLPLQMASCGSPGLLNLHPEFAALSLAEQLELVQNAWRSPVPRLLIFDGCEHEELLDQWRPVSGGCQVLVTSRRGVWDRTLGVQSLPLDVLTRDEAIALLAAHCPRRTGEVGLAALAEELGNLPLALHLAGTYLDSYPSVELAAYLERLRAGVPLADPSLTAGRRSPTRHEQSVWRTFQLSYDQLDPAHDGDEQALHVLTRAACFLPGAPVPVSLLSSASGFEVAEAFDGALRRLVGLGLLDLSTTGQPRLHQLLASFARAARPGYEAEGAVVGAVERLIHALNEQDRFPDEHERPQIYHVLEGAFARAMSAEQSERAAEIQITLDRWLLLWGEQQRVVERHLDLQRLLPQGRWRLFSLFNLISASLSMGQSSRIAPWCEEALGMALELGEEGLHDALNGLLGTYAHARGDLDQAEGAFAAMLEQARSGPSPSPVGVAKALINLGRCASDRLDFATAAARCSEAEAIARILDHQELIAICLSENATIEAELGHLDAALGLLEQALETARSIGDVEQIAVCYGQIGNCFVALGNSEQASRAFGEARLLLERLGSPTGLANLDHCEAERCLLEGRPEAALTLARRAAEVGAEHELVALAADGFRACAETLLLGGQPAAAAEAAQKAEAGLPLQRLEGLVLQGLAGLCLGQPDLAASYLTAARLLGAELHERTPEHCRTRSLLALANYCLAPKADNESSLALEGCPTGILIRHRRLASLVARL